MLCALAAAMVLQGKPLLLAHYMPWYEARPVHKNWGWHWTMNHFDANKVVNGRRQIASRFMPLLGAYDSSDPDVVECHALLMKFAGLDGAIIDWYGKEDVYDYASNHRNTELFIKALTKAGLKFAICYEDQTLPNLIKFGKVKEGEEVQHGRALMKWVAKEWFSRPNYARVKGTPAFLVFGPQFYKADQWKEILRDINLNIYGVMGDYAFATGGFGWPAPKGGDEAAKKENEGFYKRATEWESFLAVAYPRFQDIYAEAKVHDSWGSISDNNGRTFAETLDLALKSKSPIVQVATWNDWGEGTQVEPSVEFGYRDLERLQAVTKKYKPEDLRLPFLLFKARKVKARPIATLNRISKLLFAGKTHEARKMLVN